MKQYKFISKYTLKHSKWQASKVNRDAFQNLVVRDFADRKPLEVVVSDLTYVKCAGKWHYICLLLDLNNRKIIGSAVGKRKDAKHVRTAFYGVQADLRRIEIFHTDRGREFKNQIIEIISALGIRLVQGRHAEKRNGVLFTNTSQTHITRTFTLSVKRSGLCFL